MGSNAMGPNALGRSVLGRSALSRSALGPNAMGRWVAVLVGLLVLGAVNYTVYQRERLLRGGELVLLELAPVDTRDLKEGDFLALRFRVVDEAFGRGNLVGVNGEGRLVLDLDPYQIASFVRFDDGSPLTVDEMAVRFRVRIGEPTIGANGFQLREANAQRYAAARYGELRVDAAGEAILVDLRDQYLASLGGPW